MGPIQSISNLPKVKRIDGVYDLRTLRALNELGITDIGFDFRPKSPNFLQQHRFLKLLEQAYSPLHRYFLIYQDEKDFMVRKILDDLAKTPNLSMAGFFLDFRGVEDASFCRSFDFPYFIEYAQRPGHRECLSSPWARGVGLPHALVARAYAEGRLQELATNFEGMLHSAIRPSPLEVVLRTDWDADLFPSVFDFLDIDGLSLPVNDKVEVCYRNVDLSKVKGQLKFLTGTP